MFIIKLGQEALNRVECQLNDSKTIEKNNQNAYALNTNIESSILYNLLSSDCNIPEERCPRPETACPHSNSQSISVTPRPLSAPDAYSCIPIKPTNSFLSYPDKTQSKYSNLVLPKLSQYPNEQSPSMSCSTDSFSEEPMDLTSRLLLPINNESDSILWSSNSLKLIANSWLMSMIELINTNNHILRVDELPNNIRLHLLQSSWHRLLVTFLYDFLAKNASLSHEGIWRFIQSLTGVSYKSNSNVKIFKMYRNMVDDLYSIVSDLNSLEMDPDFFTNFRVALYLAGDQEDVNRKLLSILEGIMESKFNQFIEQQQQQSPNNDGENYVNYDNIRQKFMDKINILPNLIDKSLKLNSVIVETIFYSQIPDNVDTFLEKLLYNS